MLPLQNFDSHKWIIPIGWNTRQMLRGLSNMRNGRSPVSSESFIDNDQCKTLALIILPRDAKASKTWELHICTLSSLYYILCCNNLNFTKVHFPFLDNILIFLRVWINYKDFAADESKESKETLVSSDSFQFHLIL